MRQTFADIVADAAGAEEPALTDPDGMPSLGGVDPLGLRQLNFDLMDAVLPGLNNVGRRIRPFVVVAWAARRAARLAEQSGTGVVQDGVLRAFLDRIEVVYAWSHFLVRSDVQLPGRLVLAPFVSSERYEFAGPEWEAGQSCGKIGHGGRVPLCSSLPSTSWNITSGIRLTTPSG